MRKTVIRVEQPGGEHALYCPQCHDSDTHADRVYFTVDWLLYCPQCGIFLNDTDEYHPWRKA
jgi:uncharacterized C2H2 Zn-finger protein